MKVGYSYWGFLGDNKYNSKNELVSTPDGNAFYSWSIIKAFQKLGYEVVSVMPDRDIYGWTKYGEDLFSSWCKEDRANAYSRMTKTEYASYNKEDIMHSFDEYLKDVDFVLIEWRFEIIGRNDETTERFYNNGDKELNWQPDYKIQKLLIEYCNSHNIPFVVFDLDYKLTKEDIQVYNIKYIIELGDKWINENLKDCSCKKVYIPFDMTHINDISISDTTKGNLVYIGNRYERDWCIDIYIPEDMEGVKVYGNWTESGRDSKSRWPNIDFGQRLQTGDMPNIYKDYIATILLAKGEYCRYNFMTARLLEAVFYGTVPFFISEYGEETIAEYAGKYANFLTVNSSDELKDKIEMIKKMPSIRSTLLIYLRAHLKFMSSDNFVQDVLRLVGKEK